ncbi:MAG: hypothetical protein L0Z55_12245 [Planctomycetes bacterium]|nr:hypothetical protein [Planctomycetota bacterium]
MAVIGILTVDADGGAGIADVIVLAAGLLVGGSSRALPYTGGGNKPAGEALSCVQFECP